MSDARWLGWLCVSRMSFGFIFMAFTGAVPVLLREWHISAGEAGLIHTGWHLGYLVSLFAAGFLSDRFGAKRTFLAMSGAAVASALAFATFAGGFASALALYALTGLCSGGSYTPGLALISQRFTPRRRGAAMGWYLAASTLGYALSLVMGAALLAWAGWRASFVAAALGPCVGIAIAAWVLRDTRNVVAARESSPSRGRALLEVLGNKPAMLAIWAYAFHAWELLGLWAWLPAYLAAAAMKTHGSEAAASVGSLLAALSFATNALGSVTAGRLSDRVGRVGVMLAMTVTSLTCSMAFGWLFGLPLWLLTLVAIVYNLVALGDSSVYSAALTELVPAQSLGTAYSLRAAIGFGLGGISPVVFGLVLDHFTMPGVERGSMAWGMAWAALGIGAVPGLLAVLRLRRVSPCRASVA
jgi:MFS family permease